MLLRDFVNVFFRVTSWVVLQSARVLAGSVDFCRVEVVCVILSVLWCVRYLFF